MTISRLISQPITTGIVTGTLLDASNDSPLVGASVPLGEVSGVTDENGFFQSEVAGGEIRLKTINYNGSVYNIGELNINVTIGDIYNIGTVRVDRIPSNVSGGGKC